MIVWMPSSSNSIVLRREMDNFPPSLMASIALAMMFEKI